MKIPLKKFNPGKHSLLPAPGDTVKFSTLYNHTSENIIHINEVLEELEKKDVGYLLVCCRRNDSIFNNLKKLSVNRYGYYLITDFLLTDKDAVTIDARSNYIFTLQYVICLPV